MRLGWRSHVGNMGISQQEKLAVNEMNKHAETSCTLEQVPALAHTYLYAMALTTWCTNRGKSKAASISCPYPNGRYRGGCPVP